MREKIYVSLLEREIFYSSIDPDFSTHGEHYPNGVIGPFDTMRGAITWKLYGKGNPHIITTYDAERLAPELLTFIPLHFATIPVGCIFMLKNNQFFVRVEDSILRDDSHILPFLESNAVSLAVHYPTFEKKFHRFYCNTPVMLLVDSVGLL